MGFLVLRISQNFLALLLAEVGRSRCPKCRAVKVRAFRVGLAAGHPVSGDGHPVGGGDICGDGQGQVGDELGPKHPPSSYADPYQIYTSIYESGILCGYEERMEM